MTNSDWPAAISLLVALAALGVAWFGIRRSNKTTSAATLVTLNEGFRQAWMRFFESDPDDKKFNLAELLNLFEIACAIYLEKSLTGNSRQIMFEYIDSVLKLLLKDDANRQVVEDQLIESPTTFIYIKQFFKYKKGALSVTVPPQWYEL